MGDGGDGANDSTHSRLLQTQLRDEQGVRVRVLSPHAHHGFSLRSAGWFKKTICIRSRLAVFGTLAP